MQRFPAVAVLMVIVLLVLLSACANLGNLLLAPGLTRQREIHIRLAIGASRARVVRQLMTESFLLAVMGATAGAAFGAIPGIDGIGIRLAIVAVAQRRRELGPDRLRDRNCMFRARRHTGDAIARDARIAH
jgi:cell division protein FtsX